MGKEAEAAAGAVPAVSVVIVCMNQLARLRTCLDSLYAQNTRIPFEVWVVAYRFTPENLTALRELYPQVRIVESTGTRGFAENNNLALRRATGKYCFCLNDDTRMEMPAMEMLAAALDRTPDAAAVMPKLLDWDGGVQSCGDGELTPGYWFLREVGILRWGGGKRAGGERRGLFRVPSIGGTAFMIRTDVLRELGYFDERYFFTPEDAALSARANERGYHCYVEADAEIFHECHTTLKAHLLPVMVAAQRGLRIFFARESRWRDFRVSLLMAVRDLLKLFYWCFRRGESARLHRRLWRAMLATVFSRAPAKDLFVRYAAPAPDRGRGAAAPSEGGAP